MNGIIGLTEHRISCIIGDLPEERLQEQEIVVDIELSIPFEKVARTDHLQDTIDYRLIARHLDTLAITKKYKLIETFATEAIHSLFELWPCLLGVRIKIKKKAGAFNTKEAFVVLTKGNLGC
jgi:7,8-dihydroneopterin aldolase/epimerase/oxygenase